MQPTWTILLDQSTVAIVLHIYNNLPLYTIIANTNVMRHTTFNIIVRAHRKNYSQPPKNEL